MSESDAPQRSMGLARSGATHGVDRGVEGGDAKGKEEEQRSTLREVLLRALKPTRDSTGSGFRLEEAELLRLSLDFRTGKQVRTLVVAQTPMGPQIQGRHWGTLDMGERLALEQLLMGGASSSALLRDRRVSEPGGLGTAKGGAVQGSVDPASGHRQGAELPDAPALHWVPGSNTAAARGGGLERVGAGQQPAHGKAGAADAFRWDSLQRAIAELVTAVTRAGVFLGHDNISVEEAFDRLERKSQPAFVGLNRWAGRMRFALKIKRESLALRLIEEARRLHVATQALVGGPVDGGASGLMAAEAALDEEALSATTTEDQATAASTMSAHRRRVRVWLGQFPGVSALHEGTGAVLRQTDDPVLHALADGMQHEVLELHDVELVEVSRECLDGTSKGSVERRYLIDVRSGAHYAEERHTGLSGQTRNSAPVSVGPSPRLLQVGLAQVLPGPVPQRICVLQYATTPFVTDAVFARLFAHAEPNFAELPARYAEALREYPGLSEPVVLVAVTRLHRAPWWHLEDDRGRVLSMEDAGRPQACASLAMAVEGGVLQWVFGRLTDHEGTLYLKPLSAGILRQDGVLPGGDGSKPGAPLVTADATVHLWRAYR